MNKEDEVYYFAYGSNMAYRRICGRIASACKIGVARMQGHTLTFHKPGRLDGTGKCAALPTQRKSDYVLGVVYRISATALKILDGFEGLGAGYDRKLVTVRIGGDSLEVFAYFATRVDPSLTPLDWYKAHVIQGAIENEFPAAYVRKLRDIPAHSDSDQQRAARELLIYQNARE